MDPLQFAYRAKRGVDDATLTLVDSLYRHLDTCGHAARVLMVDFSSAFNTIQPHLLVQKLLSMNVNPHIILWVQDFLTGRSQRVCVGPVQSNTRIVDTGAPQGCVLSPVLFTLYTNDCRSNESNCEIIKYADDTAIIGHLTKQQSSLTSYTRCVDMFASWCCDNFLQLNITKTKELLFDFSKRSEFTSVTPIKINNEAIETVHKYKYLGTIIDDKLNWVSNGKRIYAKAQQRLYFLRKLNDFHVDKVIMNLFYKSVVESVIAFCILAYHGNSNKREINNLSRIVKRASKLIKTPCMSLDELFFKYCASKFSMIRNDEMHPLNRFYTTLKSGVRLKCLKSRTNRYMCSFVPTSIGTHNRLCTR